MVEPDNPEPESSSSCSSLRKSLLDSSSKKKKQDNNKKRRKHRKDESSDPSSSDNSDSSNDSDYRRKRHKNKSHRKNYPIKLCAHLKAKFMTTAYKSKIVRFKMDKDTLQRWIYFLTFLGTHPSTWNGAEPNPQSTPHPRSSRRSAGPSTPPRRQSPPNSPPPFRARNSHFTPTLPRRNASQPYPRRESPPRREKSPRRTQSESHNYDSKKVGKNRKDSLGILNLRISTAATEIEIKVQYQRLARIYHPDKYDPTTNKMSKSEAQENFKLINKTYEYLCT